MIPVLEPARTSGMSPAHGSMAWSKTRNFTLLLELPVLKCGRSNHGLI